MRAEEIPAQFQDTLWGGKVGGVYNSMTSQREALAKELAGITSDDLSLVTRFTSGMTFYNAYNLRATSPYWANVWKNKMAMLTPAEQKVMERIIGEYTEADTSLCKDMYGDGLTKDDIKTIMTQDAVIARNKLPFPIQLHRFVRNDAINSLFGIDGKGATETYKKLMALTDKRMIPDPAFMSASTDVSANVFTGRPFLLEIEVPQNTPIYITKNYGESECILGRDTKLEFIKLEKNADDSYIIKCRVVQ